MADRGPFTAAARRVRPRTVPRRVRAQSRRLRRCLGGCLGWLTGRRLGLCEEVVHLGHSGRRLQAAKDGERQQNRGERQRMTVKGPRKAAKDGERTAEGSERRRKDRERQCALPAGSAGWRRDPPPSRACVPPCRCRRLPAYRASPRSLEPARGAAQTVRHSWPAGARDATQCARRRGLASAAWAPALFWWWWWWWWWWVVARADGGTGAGAAASVPKKALSAPSSDEGPSNASWSNRSPIITVPEKHPRDPMSLGIPGTWVWFFVYPASRRRLR